MSERDLNPHAQRPATLYDWLTVSYEEPQLRGLHMCPRSKGYQLGMVA